MSDDPQRYGYRIGDIGLLVAQHTACEVIAIPRTARIPTTPDWLLGVANLRGGLVPIFDLRRLLALPAAQSAKSRYALILDRGEHAVGVLVSEHPTALDRLEPLPQPPPAAVRDFVSAVYAQGSSVWLEFEHRPFFEAAARRMSASSMGEST